MLLFALTCAEDDILVTVTAPAARILLLAFCVLVVSRVRGEVIVIVPPKLPLFCIVTVPLPLNPLVISVTEAEAALIVIVPLLLKFLLRFNYPVITNAFIVVVLVPPIIFCE